MKKLVFAMVILCVTVTFFTPSLSIADELESLKQSLKDCNSGSCLENLQNKAEQIFDRVGKNFDDDFVMISNEISINHCRSLIQEMFYHMKTLKSYYNFKNVFYLKELKKLKENRARLDREKITSNDFNRMTRQIEEQYKDDIEASQNFVNDKIWRLQGLCDNLNGNVETTQGRVRLKSGTLSESLKERVLSLRNETIWVEFESNSKEGKKIEDAIRLASNSAGNGLIPSLKGIFSGFESSMTGAVFSTTLIESLVEKYYIP